VVTWGAQAENVAQHLTKGRRVAVAGRLEFRRWTDAEARSHAKHEVLASESSSSTRPARGPHRLSRPTPPAKSPSSSRPRGRAAPAARPAAVTATIPIHPVVAELLDDHPRSGQWVCRCTTGCVA
jgi:single-strand DNA-binding protein